MEAQVEREEWSHPAEFILSCIGLTVGLGNIWRFPYLAYANGGAAFLIPYIICLIFFGYVILLLEIGIGQFTSRGPLHAFEFIPIAKGVAIAMIIPCFYISSYYSLIMAYVFFYMGHSFYSPLPWSKCLAWWGATEQCSDNINETAISSRSFDIMNIKLDSIDISKRVNMVNASEFTSNLIQYNSPAQQFWDIYVTAISSGIDIVGSPKWDIVLCLLITWFLLFLCLFKGLKLTGKVSYFTASSPYFFLILFAVYGMALEGAFKGLNLLVVPQWDRLLNAEVWVTAANQICFSLSASTGALTSYGSYNKFHYPVRKSIIFICFMDFVASFLGAIATFSVIGNLAHTYGKNVETVVNSGPGLIFVTYPLAMSQLWLPNLFAFLFFLTMILLGIDSLYAMLETILTVCKDTWPITRLHHELMTLIVCCLMFCISIIYSTNAGLHILSLVDHFGGNTCLLIIAFFEFFVVMWIYGARRFYQNMSFMLARKFTVIEKTIGAVIMPIALCGLASYGLYNMGTHGRPDVALAIGLIILLSIVLQPIIMIFILVLKNYPDLQKLVSPNPTWGPANYDDYLEWTNYCASTK